MTGWNGISTAVFCLTVVGFFPLICGTCAGIAAFAVIGLVAWLTAAALMAMLVVVLIRELHRAWKVIQPLRHMDPAERWMPAPWLAVALLFVPLFNFYWAFVAIGSLPRRMNKYAALSGIAVTAVDEDAPRALCRSCLLAFFPMLNLFVILAWPTLVFETCNDINRTTNELLEKARPPARFPE
jgi:hypothetical protein